MQGRVQAQLWDIAHFCTIHAESQGSHGELICADTCVDLVLASIQMQIWIYGFVDFGHRDIPEALGVWGHPEGQAGHQEKVPALSCQCQARG